MTIMGARNGLSLVASRRSKALFDIMKARSAGVSTGLLQTTTSSPGLLYPCVAVLKCQPIICSRGYSDDQIAPELRHRPSDFDRKILVWSKTYASLEEIPEIISHAKMKKAKDVFRIRVNIWMGIITVFGCVVMIYLGRKEAKEGNSLAKENLLWHKSIKEKADAEKSD